MSELSDSDPPIAHAERKAFHLPGIGPLDARFRARDFRRAPAP